MRKVFPSFSDKLALELIGFKVYFIVACCYKAIRPKHGFWGKLGDCGQLCFAEDAEGVRSARLTIKMTS